MTRSVTEGGPPMGLVTKADVTHIRGASTTRDGRSRIAEIEGLRAVAAILVASFHIWVGGVSGGVDVFFVVSGLLITTSLLGHLDRWGAVRPAHFVARLARRLFPAALTVGFASALLAVLLLPRFSWRDLGEQLIASTFYVQNWWLAFNAVDYDANDQSRSFLQHFWAMSVQMQFYLLWLVVFMIAGWAASKASRRPRVVIGVVIAALAAGSFLHSMVSTSWNPEFAYFDSTARVWEFAAGAACAFLIGRGRLNGVLAGIMSWVGLGALLATAPIAGALQADFPGAIAVLPVAGAAAVLLTVGSSPSWGAGALLSARPMVWLGSLAYGIYLWHWPLLMAVETVRGFGPRSLLAGGVILGGSIMLAWLTQRFIEKPFLTRSDGDRGARSPAGLAQIGVGIAATMTFGIALVVVPAGSTGAVSRPSESGVVLESGVCWGAASLDRENTCTPPPGNEILPAFDPREDLAAIHTPECSSRGGGDRFLPCTWGDEDSSVRVLLIGNSHAGAYFPALLALAEEQGWRLDTHMKSACTYHTTYRRTSSSEWEQSCRAWNTRLREYLAEQEPYDLVVTSANANNSDFVGPDGVVDASLGVPGYVEVWTPLIDAGAALVVLRDYPTAPVEALDCALLNPVADCTFSRLAQAVPINDDIIAQAALTTPGAHLVDLTPWVCDGDTCRAVQGNVYTYRNSGHISATYAATLAPYLDAELRAIEPLVSLFSESRLSEVPRG